MTTTLPNVTVSPVIAIDRYTGDTMIAGMNKFNANDAALAAAVNLLNGLSATLPWSNLQSSTFPPNIAAVIAGTYSVGGGGGGGGDVYLASANIFTAEQTIYATGTQLHIGYNTTSYANFSVDTAGVLTQFATGGLVMQPVGNLQLNPSGNLSEQPGGTITSTATGNHTLNPSGNIIINPTGNSVLPTFNYDIDLGRPDLKLRSLWAGDLYVETLVAQQVTATIGGRVVVGPANVMSADCAPSDTQIIVKYNSVVSGDILQFENGGVSGAGQFEFMQATSGPVGTGPYTVQVTRNLQATTAKQWYAGDSLVNTGQTGNGFIDLYSVRGMVSGFGPTIAFNIRNSNTYNDVTPHAAIGNLNGLYGYATDNYGVAMGTYSATNGVYQTIDSAGGIIMWGPNTGHTATLPRLQIQTDGTLRMCDTNGNNIIMLQADGTNYFANPLSLGTGGGIYQGSGTFAAPSTGLKIWNNAGVGSIAGYGSGTQKWYAHTDGTLRAGGGSVKLDETGLTLNTGVATYNQLTWKTGAHQDGFLSIQQVSGSTYAGYYTVAGTGGGGLASIRLSTNGTANNALFEFLSDTTSVLLASASGIGTSSSYSWKLETYHATAPGATGYVQVTINGTVYKLLAST